MSDPKRPPSQLVVRNLDPELIRRLKARAAANGRSAEAEHRAILDAALRPEVAEWWAECARLRDELARQGRRFEGSEHFIREERDRGWGRD